MSIPGIILTSKYTLPDSKSFNNYVNYLTREKALLEKEQLKLTEENELLRISSARKTLFDNVYNGLDVKESSNDIKHKIQDEANKVLDNKFDFDVMSNQDYTKMVSYMARSYALEKKKTRTPAEQSELEKVKSAMMDSQKVAKKNDGILNGVFNQSTDFVRFGDLDDVKDRFVEAQNNESVGSYVKNPDIGAHHGKWGLKLMANISSSQSQIVINEELLLNGIHAVKIFLNLVSLSANYVDYDTYIDYDESMCLLEDSVENVYELSIDFSGTGRWSYTNNVEYFYQMLEYVASQ